MEKERPHAEFVKTERLKEWGFKEFNEKFEKYLNESENESPQSE